MRRLALAWPLVALVACGAKSPPPDVAPPPPAPVATAPARAPTLAIETRYSPDLTLTLRLDGVPYGGDARMVPLGASGFEGSPGDLVTEPSDRGLDLRRSEAGVFVADAALLGAFADARGFELVVSDRRYPYPHASGTSPAVCSAGLSAARKIDPCRERRPSADVVPAGCDDAGAAGYRGLVATLDGQVDQCWAALDDRTLSAFGALRDAVIVQEACARLAKLAGPDVATPTGARLVPACVSHFPEATQQRLLLARRTEDLPAAFERVKRLSSAEMHQFVLDYSITGDARIDEIRRLALDRFGPKDRAAFVRARKALATVHVDGWETKLCDLDADRAQVAFVRSPRAALETEDGGSRACLLARKVVMRRPPDALVARARAIVKSTTKAKDMSWSWGCNVDHWYLEDSTKKH